MKVSVWVTTYRRPEMLKSCLVRLEGINRPVYVLHPGDERHDLPSWCQGLVTPSELTGMGVVGPRYMACAMAMSKGDEAAIFVEDDVVLGRRSRGHVLDVNKKSVLTEQRPAGRALNLFVEDLEKWDNLAVVQWAGAFPPLPKKARISPWLPYHNSWGHCFALRLGPYREVGGFDLRLRRMEEVDLALRLRVAGYDLARDLRVALVTTVYQPGGISETEGGTSEEERREAAARARLGYSKVVSEKWPDNTFKLSNKGWLSFRNRRLEELQGQYKQGVFKLTVGGLVWR